ncbi:MAG: hypothetical protein HZA51_04195 [Planctomycetes bacterium]|nr:hypothetical protein [Planctomycetota bacterium]
MKAPVRHLLAIMIATLVVIVSDSCTPNALQNINAITSDFVGPSGSPTPRALQVGFINNTPFRAIFTFGSYDQLNKDTLPTGFGQLRLEGNTASAQVVQPCRKTFSLGGDELIQMIDENRNDPAINITDERALVRGVNFSGAAIGDPLAAEPTEGTAEPRLFLNGVDFSCVRTDIRQTTGTGLLLFTFEQDATAPGGFRIDFSFMQP